MVEDVDFTAVDGPPLPDVRPGGLWPWLLVAVGVAIVAIGGTLLDSSHDQPPATPAPSAVSASGT